MTPEHLGREQRESNRLAKKRLTSQLGRNMIQKKESPTGAQPADREMTTVGTTTTRDLTNACSCRQNEVNTGRTQLNPNPNKGQRTLSKVHLCDDPHVAV